MPSNEAPQTIQAAIDDATETVETLSVMGTTVRGRAATITQYVGRGPGWTRYWWVLATTDRAYRCESQISGRHAVETARRALAGAR